MASSLPQLDARIVPPDRADGQAADAEIGRLLIQISSVNLEY
jgi:hypothetical protein